MIRDTLPQRRLHPFVAVLALAVAAPMGAGGVPTGPPTGPPTDLHATNVSTTSQVARHLPPAFLLEWGSEGTGNGEFHGPVGVAAHSSGVVYVSDQSLNRIQKFDNQGNYQAQWGSAGTAENQFDHPWGLAVDSVGNLYVADYLNNRIQKFDSDGTFLLTWGYGVLNGNPGHQVCTSSCLIGLISSGGDCPHNPNGIFADAANKIYVTSRANRHVEKFDNDGTPITSWGSDGATEGQFFGGPNDVVVDSQGYVFTIEDVNARIQVFDSSGNFVRMWGWGVQDGSDEFQVCTSGCQAGLQGVGDWQFHSLSGLAVDPDDFIYATDYQTSRVYKFDRLGTRLVKWENGNGTALNGPVHINVLGSALYLTDASNDRIIKYGGPYFETIVADAEQMRK